MNPEDVAAVCHEANRRFCVTLGDFSQKEWAAAPRWQRVSAVAGVRFLLDNPGATASATHESWLKEKEADGWTYGPEKDADSKVHPCMVPFENLPPEQQAKDVLFKSIVDSLRSLVNGDKEPTL